MAAACEGLETEQEIAAALDRAAEQIDPEKFAAQVEQLLVHGAILGAVDSMLEREQDEQEPMPALASWRQTQLPLLQKQGKLTAIPFAAAEKLFRERQVVDRETFDQLKKAAKQKAFTVAGLAIEELLATAHAELARQVAESRERTYFDEQTGKWVYRGPNLREFRRTVKERLESAGWTPASPSHVETIFRTNIMGAYSSGGVVERTQPAVLKARPFWQIRAVGDSRTRPAHKRADGTILPATHPFWRTAYPPFGYNCRCRVISRSAKWVEANGGATRVPTGLPDPGFSSGIDASLIPVDAATIDAGTREPTPGKPAHPIQRPLQPAQPRAPLPPQGPPLSTAPAPVSPQQLPMPTGPQRPPEVHGLLADPLPNTLPVDATGTPLRPAPFLERRAIRSISDTQAAKRGRKVVAEAKEIGRPVIDIVPSVTAEIEDAVALNQEQFAPLGRVDLPAQNGLKKYSYQHDHLIREYQSGKTREQLIASEIEHQVGKHTFSEETMAKIRFLAPPKVDDAIRAAHEIERAFIMAEDAPVKVTYRGMHMKQEELTKFLGRDEFEFGGKVTSSSYDPNIAMGFAEGGDLRKESRVLLELHRKSKGIAIQSISEFEHEAEVLLHGNTRWKVVGREWDGRTWLVKAEEF